MTDPGETSAQRLAQYGGVQRVPSPQLELFQRRHFIAPELCQRLITLIECNRRPSTLADYNGDPDFRTSETCDLAADDPAVREVEAQLHALSGIDPAYGEPMQGQRYDVGQEFKPHVDWFNPQGADWEKYCQIAGQRSWTFMIYLNDVPGGGATLFTHIKKRFQPEMGKLLCWNNRTPDQLGNVNTMHHGMKVRKGVKYIITKWYRERPWQ